MGPSIRDLGPVWRRLLGCEALLGLVSERQLSKRKELLGCYVCCFITDAFVSLITDPPLTWIGPALVNGVMRGPSPLLSDAEVRKANSTTALNLLIWPSCPHVDYENLPELREVSQKAFFEAYRGYNLKRLCAQTTSVMEMVMALNSGGWCLRAENRTWINKLEEPAETYILKPHLLEITRERALKYAGTWVYAFFSHTKPVIGFSRGEQRLLLAALRGGTDEELANLLRVSVPAVKKTWRLIYQRAGAKGHELITEELSGKCKGNRGREKKHRLLAYLRDHPEELRPVSLKLLEK